MVGGCGPTHLVDVPHIMDTPRIPMRVGLYFSPDVRTHTKVIGVVKFDIGNILVQTVQKQCHRAFDEVREVARFPWAGDEVTGLDMVLVLNRRPDANGWISGPTQWTATGKGSMFIHSVDGSGFTNSPNQIV